MRGTTWTLLLCLIVAAVVWWLWVDGADAGADGDSAVPVPGGPADASSPIEARRGKPIDTDRFTDRESSNPERFVTRFRVINPVLSWPGRDPVTVDLDGWITVDDRTLVPVTGGVSEPVEIRAAEFSVTMLFPGHSVDNNQDFIFDAPDGERPNELTLDAPGIAPTLQGRVQSQGTPIPAGSRVELDVAGVPASEPDLWLQETIEVPVYEDGRFLVSLGEEYRALEAAFMNPTDRANRFVGPLDRPLKRTELLEEADDWNLGVVDLHEPGVIALARCVWPEDNPPRPDPSRWMDLFIKKAGTPDDTAAQFTISVQRAPTEWVEIRGTSPWPTFEAWARYGAYRWRSPRPIVAGGNMVMDFEATGSVVGWVKSSDPGFHAPAVDVDARGAGGVHAGTLRFGGKFEFASLPAGTWTIVARTLGGRSVARTGVVVVGGSKEDMPVDVGTLRLPEVATTKRRIEVVGPDGKGVPQVRASLVDAPPSESLWSKPVSGEGGVTLEYPVGFDGRVVFNAIGFVSRSIPMRTLSDRITLSRGVGVNVLFPERSRTLYQGAPVHVTTHARERGTRDWGEVVIGFEDGDGYYMGTWPAGATIELRLKVSVRPPHQEPRVTFIPGGTIAVPKEGPDHDHRVSREVWHRVRAAAR